MRFSASLLSGVVLVYLGAGTVMAQPSGMAPMTAPAAAAPKPDSQPKDADTPAWLTLVGKAPPPIDVAKWVKGTPLTGFEKGKVYVVDFWATWCGPCKAAIPHLTKLAHEYAGKVEVVGVSISERQKDASDTAYIDKVASFVNKMGDRMDYRVAVDTPDKKMHDTWFKAAGTGGIPTAYIIDQQGLVAWVGIGSPKTVERIVGAVLAGTFNVKQEIEHERAEEAAAKKRSALDIAFAKKNDKTIYAKVPGYREAMDRGDQAAALESLNAAFQADPSAELPAAYQWKFMILMQRNKASEVNQYARELLGRYPNNGDVVGFVSAVIVATDEEPRFDKQLALQAATKAAALATPDTRWAQFTKWRLGWAYFHTGNTEKAIEEMQSALDNVKRLKARPNNKLDFGDLESECEDALAEFRKVKKAA